MFERLRERVLRRTPHGRLDVLATVQNVVGSPRSANELTPEAYLQSLGEQDRVHVQDFLTYARALHASLNGIGLAVTAVGSTVRAEVERHHPPSDIDLRILNSVSPQDAESRATTVGFIRYSIRGHLQANGLEFEEEDHTTEVRMVESISIGHEEDPATGKIKSVRTKGLAPDVDWYNTDPSFVVRYQEGLPLQLSVSGTNNWDLDTYLRKEREHNAYFVLLMHGRSTRE